MKGLYALVGMKHKGTESTVASMKDGEPVALIREANNPHDPNAVAVWWGLIPLGYIKASQAKKLTPVIDARPSPTNVGMKGCLRVAADRWPMIEVEENQ